MGSFEYGRRIPMARKLLVTAFLAGVLSVGAATPGVAQNQRGLVNIAVGDVTIQVPVALAANICDVNVAVLVGDFRDDGEADCTTVAGSEATVTRGPASTPVVQRGLVNVAIGDVTVQVPIAAALNLCDVNLAVLVADFFDGGGASCEAEAGSGASG
jgi:hypothetical protein